MSVISKSKEFFSEWGKVLAMGIALALPIIDGILLASSSIEAQAVGIVLLCPSIPCAVYLFAEGLSTHLHPEKDGQL